VPSHFKHNSRLYSFVRVCNILHGDILCIANVTVAVNKNKEHKNIMSLFKTDKKQTTTAVLWPFFRDHPSEPVPEENFWTLRCKGRLTEADTPIIRLGATPSGLTSAHLHHPPIFYRPDALPFLLPNQQCQSTEDKKQTWKLNRTDS